MHVKSSMMEKSPLDVDLISNSINDESIDESQKWGLYHFLKDGNPSLIIQKALEAIEAELKKVATCFDKPFVIETSLCVWRCWKVCCVKS